MHAIFISSPGLPDEMDFMHACFLSENLSFFSFFSFFLFSDLWTEIIFFVFFWPFQP